jgi:signal peptidase I
MKLYTDFGFLLMIAVLLTGFIWFVGKKFIKSEKEPWIVEFSRLAFPMILIVFLIRSFIAEPFRIPSGSMKPTLETGDFILVNKFNYGLKLPGFNTQLLSLGKPKRGDVIVFRYPQNPDVNLIKRVVGLPGEKIEYKNNILFINGKPQLQEFQGKEIDAEPGSSMMVNRYIEQLNGKSHAIYLRSAEKIEMEERIVPEGQYFVAGDNRNNSHDSRYWGFVPEEMVKGRAFFIWMSWNGVQKDIRWHHVWSKID